MSYCAYLPSDPKVTPIKLSCDPRRTGEHCCRLDNFTSHFRAVLAPTTVAPPCQGLSEGKLTAEESCPETYLQLSGLGSVLILPGKLALPVGES